MIRLIIVAITVIGFLILSIPILFIEWIIGHKGNQLPAHHSGSFQIYPVGSRHKGNDHR